jgi:hypothetical protein
MPAVLHIQAVLRMPALLHTPEVALHIQAVVGKRTAVLDIADKPVDHTVRVSAVALPVKLPVAF